MFERGIFKHANCDFDYESHKIILFEATYTVRERACVRERERQRPRERERER